VRPGTDLELMDPMGPQAIAATKMGLAVGPEMNTVFYKEFAGGPAKKESLGTQTMEGVAADGSRTTITLDVGAIGNDRPIQIVNERWYSQDLQTVVMTRRNDPRTGEEVFRLTNINRSEPSPDLFQVPPSYQMVDQK